MRLTFGKALESWHPVWDHGWPIGYIGVVKDGWIACDRNWKRVDTAPVKTRKEAMMLLVPGKIAETEGG